MPLAPTPDLQACIGSLVGVCDWGQGDGGGGEMRRRWGPPERVGWKGLG